MFSASSQVSSLVLSRVIVVLVHQSPTHSTPQILLLLYPLPRKLERTIPIARFDMRSLYVPESVRFVLLLTPPPLSSQCMKPPSQCVSGVLLRVAYAFMTSICAWTSLTNSPRSLKNVNYPTQVFSVYEPPPPPCV